MRERKKTAVHGTLEMIPLAWKFNSKQHLCKTLNSRMNIIETRAVLNIVETDGKWAPEAQVPAQSTYTLKTVPATEAKWYICILAVKKKYNNK